MKQGLLRGLVVLALLALLFLWWRGPGERAEESSRGDRAGEPAPPGQGRGDGPAGPAAASGTSGAGARRAVDPPLAGDPAVRDHRGEAAPAGPYVIAEPVIRATRAALRAGIEACQEQFGSEVRPGARLEARLGMNVRAGVLRVAEVELDATGLGPSGLVACARRAAAEIEVPAERHAEVEHHTLTFPFTLPLK